MKDLQKIYFQFVCNEEQDRTARKTTIKAVKSSGLDISDIKMFMLIIKFI